MNPSINYAQEVHVAKVATDIARYTSIQAAIDAITDNVAGKRYAVIVHPGIYTGKIIMEDYIDLIASGGREETLISFTATAHDEATLTAENALIKGFTIVSDGNTGTLRARSVTASTAGFKIEDCVLVAQNSAAAANCFSATVSCTIVNCEIDTAAGAAAAARFDGAAQTYTVDGTTFGGATYSLYVFNTGTITATQCTCSNLLNQLNGTVNIRRCRMEEVSLNTAPCVIDVELSQFTATITTNAEAFAHSITLRECNLNAQGITSNATVATTITLHGCTNVGVLTQAGTGAVGVYKSSLGAISNNSTATMTVVDSALVALVQAAAAGTINITNCSMTTISTGATGTVRLNGGCLFTDISANAGVLTWKVDPNHIKVVAGTANMKVANALLLAAIGDVIQIMPGTYAESNLTLVAGVNLVGTDHNQCIIEVADAANAILNAGVTCTISDLTISNTNAGHPAIEVTANILTVLNCIVRGFAAGNAIAMLAGTLALEGCAVSIGNVNLSTAPCALSATVTKFSDHIDTAGAFAHTMTLLGCDFVGANINSVASGATTLTLANCGRVGTVSNAGSAAFTIRDSDVGTVTATLTGTIGVTGGHVGACGGATAAILWQTAPLQYEVVPGMRIQDSLAAGAGGRVIIHAGAHAPATSLTVSANTLVEGDGVATIVTSTGAAIVNGWIIGGHNITMKNMKLMLAAGAGAGAARPNVIYASVRNQLWLEDLWCVGDTTVGDDASDERQNGIYLRNTTDSKIVNCRCDTNRRHGIYFKVVTADTLIQGCTCKLNLVNGIFLDNGSTRNSLSGNQCLSNTVSGIRLLDNSLDNALTGNVCQGNTVNGIIIETSSNNSLTGNNCQGNGNHGIYIWRSSYCGVTGGNCDDNTADGVNITGSGGTNADYNRVIGVGATGNGGDGIEIVGGALANKNSVGFNQLLGNVGTPLVDGGTLTEVGHNITA